MTSSEGFLVVCAFRTTRLLTSNYGQCWFGCIIVILTTESNGTDETIIFIAEPFTMWIDRLGG